jgi:fido (protein-threonine AMPylation protein)
VISADRPDPVRTFTAEENERLASNLREVTRRLFRGEFRDRRADLALLQALHGATFGGVRDHAGRIRRADFGQEFLSFGPNRSEHRSLVEARVSEVFDRLRKSIASFDDNPDDPTYERNAFHTALWVHAELIRIHPFEDGNGRSSRLVMNWILLRLGLRPVSFEVVKYEYFDCLNQYFELGHIDALVDLALRLYRT